MSTGIYHVPMWNADLDLDAIYAISDWIPFPAEPNFELRVFLKTRPAPFTLTFSGKKGAEVEEAATRSQIRADLLAAWQQRKLEHG